MQLFDIFPDDDDKTEEEPAPKKTITNPYIKFIEDCDAIMENRVPIDDIIAKIDESYHKSK